MQIRAGLLFHPDAFWRGGDVWEGVRKLGPAAAAAALAAVFISGGSKIEDENFIATYFVLKHDPGTLGGC